MNRRQLIASLLGLPFAKPAIVAALAGPAYQGLSLDYISQLDTATLYGEMPYSIPYFINEGFHADGTEKFSEWVDMEITQRDKAFSEFKLSTQRATYQFKEQPWDSQPSK